MLYFVVMGKKTQDVGIPNDNRIAQKELGNITNFKDSESSRGEMGS